MAVLVYRSVAAFAAFKMAHDRRRHHGHGVSGALPIHARAAGRLVLYGVLMVYAGLIGYEIWMLQALERSAGLVNSPDRRHIPYCGAFG